MTIKPSLSPSRPIGVKIIRPYKELPTYKIETERPTVPNTVVSRADCGLYMYMVSLVLLAQYRVLYKYWFCLLDSGLGLFGGHWSRSLIDYGYGAQLVPRTANVEITP
jgi:hypothetical protein